MKGQLVPNISVNQPPAWRRQVKDIIAMCEDGPASISIEAPPGSGADLILDLVQKRLARKYDHVVRLDGRVFAVAELQLRTWLDATVPDITDTFSALGELLEKSQHVALLIDRASPMLLSAINTRAVEGAVIATCTPGTIRLASHVTLADFPANRGWDEVNQRREAGVIVAPENSMGPMLSSIPAIAALDEQTMRNLVEAVEASADTDTSHITLGHVLQHLLPQLSSSERAALRALTLLGPGLTKLSQLGTVVAGRRHVLKSYELQETVDSLATRGLLRTEGEYVAVDAGLIAAIHNPRVTSAAKRRAALHLLDVLIDESETPVDERLEVACRLLDWCNEVTLVEPSVVKLRELVTERLVERGLLESARLELSAALTIDAEYDDTEARAHHQVDSGIISGQLGQYERALEEFEGALADFGRVARMHRNEAVTMSNIGMVYQQLGRHRAAVDTLDHARSLLLRANEDTTLDDLNISLSLAMSLLALGQTSRVEAELRSIDTQIRRCTADETTLAELRSEVIRLRRLVTNNHSK